MTRHMETTALHHHPFMQRLSGPQLERLAPCASEARYEAGSFIFREGAEAGTVYFLRSGCVALEQHIPGQGTTQVESLCAGDIVGLSWLFPQARWTLDARCVEPVDAFALRAECVRERMKEDPSLGLELMTHVVQALYQRLVRVRLQRLDVYRAQGG